MPVKRPHSVLDMVRVLFSGGEGAGGRGQGGRVEASPSTVFLTCYIKKKFSLFELLPQN